MFNSLWITAWSSSSTLLSCNCHSSICYSQRSQTKFLSFFETPAHETWAHSQHWPWQHIHPSDADDCDHRERQYKQGTSALVAVLLQNRDSQTDFDFGAALGFGAHLSSFILLPLADCLFSGFFFLFISWRRAISVFTGVSVNTLVFPCLLCLPPNFLGGAVGYGLSSWGEKCWRVLILLLAVGVKLDDVSDPLVVTWGQCYHAG